MRGHRPLDPRNPAHALLGSNLVLGWHRTFGIDQAAQAGEVTKWLDFVRLQSLAATGAGARPTFAADGTAFGSKPVVKCATSGARYLRATGMSAALFPSGTRPWMGMSVRLRTSGTINWAGLTGVDGTTVQLFLYSIAAGLSLHGYMQNTEVVQGTYTLSKLFAEVWSDGTKGYVRVNGTAVSANYASATSQNCTNMSIGAGISASAPSDLSVAALYLARAYPGDQVCAGVRAIDAAEHPP